MKTIHLNSGEIFFDFITKIHTFAEVIEKNYKWINKQNKDNWNNVKRLHYLLADPKISKFCLQSNKKKRSCLGMGFLLQVKVFGDTVGQNKNPCQFVLKG